MDAHTDTSEILSDLRQMLGTKNVITEAGALIRYCRDWSGDSDGKTLAALCPTTTEEVSRVVKYCLNHELILIPQGGHSGLVCGAMPQDSQSHLVLSLERMNKIRKISALDFSMDVDAGCILENVKQAADDEGCLFPLSLGAQGSCQIGGNVATNAGGLNVLRYGMMRELILGLEVVLPNGEIFESMSSLRKDNRGIDLKQIFIGSEGTMGIVTGASLKLFPKPDHVVTSFVGLNSIEDAITLFAQARRDCCDLLSAFELISGECVDLAFKTMPSLKDPLESRFPVNVLLEVSASGPLDLQPLVEKFLMKAMESGLVLDGTLAASKAQSANLWLIREAMTEGQAQYGRHLRTDVSVAISDMPAFIRETDKVLQKAFPDSQLIPFGHIGDGNVHYNVLPPHHLADEEKIVLLKAAEKMIFEMVDQFGGSISAEHGIGRLKQVDFLKRMSDSQRFLLDGLKAMVDPEEVLNSGCILPLKKAC